MKSYHPYKYGLRLWDGDKLQALERVSTLVDRLIQPNQTSWLIYPKEIEIILNTIQGIKESAIIGVKHSDLGEVPIAILVVDSKKKELSDNEIVEALDGKLAKFKIPKSF